MFDKRVGAFTVILCLVFGTQIAGAQAPATIVYQGRLATTAGAPVTGSHTVTFRLYEASFGGTSLWTETHPVTADDNGLFTIELGGTDPIDATVFDGNKRYLGLSLDGGLEMMPRQLISSTAYAVSARLALVADGSITGAKLADGAVTGIKVQDGTIGAPKLTDGAVINSKLAAGAVSTEKIQDETIASNDIAPGAVGTSEIATGAVTGTQVADKTIDGVDIVDDLYLGTSGPGFMQCNNEAGTTIIATGQGELLGGLFYAYDASGTLITGMNAQNGFVFGSTLGAYNSNDSLTAGIIGETGEVFGTVKSFVVPDPLRADRMIQYSCIEGPEAAIYCRGQAELVGGSAQISFPEHFAAMAAPGTVTVTLTPRSTASHGLAAIDVTTSGMQVGELANGTNSYAFDYVVYAVRKGYENYEVYRNRKIEAAAVQRPSRAQGIAK